MDDQTMVWQTPDFEVVNTSLEVTAYYPGTLSGPVSGPK
ncbi:pyrroloquinoline quinone precursor peptide PqqA [Actinomadura rupiterrae]|nr:pyrroloquinoline quinone precursor peptide PqqA [Actinomadura rupiterrae]MCP2342569.1 coenzyme PQQ precursor peptide PqqA [Actinomadura rupiterrae]